MTGPPQPRMTDERLDRLVRQLLGERAEDVAAMAVSNDAMVERVVTRLQPSPVARGWLLLAATMLAVLLIGGALIVGGHPRLPSLPTQPPAPPAPSVPPVSPAERVLGWPDTNENQAGLYSWDGSVCAGAFCTMGFMHNGYGSGDVEIRFVVVPEGSASDDEATEVTLAGHDAIYRLNAGREEWIVDIEGTTIAILLTARPGTSQADLDDAHAIIESMRHEPRDNRLGFRLVFRIPSDDWDSG